MRNELCKSMVASAARQDLVFLTGDLGYAALEPLREALGERFINAGVAEQNMVCVAAGLARSGLRPWVYSIAPFVCARPFEQIRNDVAMHDLPVRLVGNGGGYAYGVMGGTHHALEDYGVLLTLANMLVFAPAFRADVGEVIRRLHEFPHPAYLRLGAGEEPAGHEIPPYEPWRRLLDGGGTTLVVVGPVVGPIWAAAEKLPEAQRPRLWVLGELPLLELPDELIKDLRDSRRLIVAEEHVAQGGAGMMLAHRLLERGIALESFQHFAALGYPSGTYGSQKFHRRECGLDPEAIVEQLIARKDGA